MTVYPDMHQKSQIEIKNKKASFHYELLTKRELRKIERAVKETGLTIVPTRLYINDKGLAKLDIAVARGKKLYDKRESIKEKDLRRDMERYRR